MIPSVSSKVSYLKRKTFASEKGFSILQVMIIASILGVVSVGVNISTKNAIKMSTLSNQNMEIMDVVSQISSVLQNKESCTETFKNNSSKENGSTVDKIYHTVDGKKSVKFEVGSTYGAGSSKVTIKEMRIKNYNKVYSDKNVNFVLGQSTLEIQILKAKTINEKTSKDKTIGPLKIVRRIPVNTLLYRPEEILEDQGKDPTLIKECLIDKGKMLESSCNTLEGDYRDLTNCRSITIKEGNKSYALNVDGNVQVGKSDFVKEDFDQSGDLNVANDVETLDKDVINDLWTKGKLTLGKGNNIIQVESKGTSLSIKIPTQSPIEKIKIGFKNGQKKLYLNVENQVLKIKADGLDKLITFPKIPVGGTKTNESLAYGSNKSEWLKSTEEIATKSWGLAVFKELFTQDADDILQNEIKDILDKIKPDDAMEAVLTGFAKGICNRWFGLNFQWSDTFDSCYIKKSCGERGFLSLGNKDDNSEDHIFTCRNLSVGTCVNDWTSGSGSGKKYSCTDYSVDPVIPTLATVASICDNALGTNSNSQTKENSGSCEKLAIKQISISGSSQQDCNQKVGEGNVNYKNGQCNFYAYQAESCQAMVINPNTNPEVVCNGDKKINSNYCGGGAALCNAMGAGWEVVELDNYESDIGKVWNTLRTDEGYATQ